MISQKARYAFKALLALARAREGGSLQSREIALAGSIPQSFLEQILLELKRNGIVGSRRGREGGYFLIKDPAAISFGQILRLVDGPVAPLPCLSRTAYRPCPDCADEATCELRHAFGRIYASQVALLDSTSIAQAMTTGDTAAPTLRAVLEKAV